MQKRFLYDVPMRSFLRGQRRSEGQYVSTAVEQNERKTRTVSLSVGSHLNHVILRAST